MKKKLIAFKVEGVKELGKFFHHFLAESQITSEEEREEQLIRLFPNNWEIYMNKFNFIHGMNASGKTQFLDMIKAVESFSWIGWDRRIKPKIDFSFFNTFAKEIKVTSFFAVDNCIFKQKINFTLDKEILNGNIIDIVSFNKRSIVNIFKEELSVINVHESHYSKDLIELITDDKLWDANSTVLNLDENASEEIDIGSLNTVTPLSGIKAQEYLLKDMMIRENIFLNENNEFLDPEEYKTLSKQKRTELMSSLGKLSEKSNEKFQQILGFVIPESLPGNMMMSNIVNEPNLKVMDYISIFDKSIKSITYDAALGGVYTISFKGGKSVRTTILNGILSSGTIRGLAVLKLIIEAIENGEDIYIDELESNFNSKIIKFIITALKDPSLNKNGSRFFASTHYPETLNNTSRRDSIFITEYREEKRTVTKLIDIEDIEKVKSRKNDYKNSKLISMLHSRNIEPTHEDYVKFKRKINGK